MMTGWAAECLVDEDEPDAGGGPGGAADLLPSVVQVGGAVRWWRAELGDLSEARACCLQRRCGPADGRMLGPGVNEVSDLGICWMRSRDLGRCRGAVRPAGGRRLWVLALERMVLLINGAGPGFRHGSSRTCGGPVSTMIMLVVVPALSRCECCDAYGSVAGGRQRVRRGLRLLWLRQRDPPGGPEGVECRMRRGFRRLRVRPGRDGPGLRSSRRWGCMPWVAMIHEPHPRRRHSCRRRLDRRWGAGCLLPKGTGAVKRSLRLLLLRTAAHSWKASELERNALLRWA